MSTAVVDFDTRTSRPTRRANAPTCRQRRARTEARPTAGVRLTRRGRVVVVLIAAAAAFGAFTLMSDPAVSTSEEHHGQHEQVVVEPGQSLWDIAGSIAPNEDPRDVIAEIVDLNALESSGSIQAGQLLYVPNA
jgi:hypothetical protein